MFEVRSRDKPRCADRVIEPGSRNGSERRIDGGGKRGPYCIQLGIVNVTGSSDIAKQIIYRISLGVLCQWRR